MKNIILTFISIAVFATTACTTANAQTHELSVYAGGGLSSLNADMTPVFEIDNKHKTGGMAGVGYAYNFSPLFAIQTGVEASLLQSQYKIDQINGNYIIDTPAEKNVEFNYTLSGYSEKVKAAYISIPIMARIRLPLGNSFKWSAALGTKLGIAAHSRYKSHYTQLQTAGIVVNNGEVVDTDPLTDLPEQGFGIYKNGADKGGLKLSAICTLSAETGVAYNINKRYSVYTGIYVDYALNDINKKRNRPFVAYNTANPSPPIINGILNAVNKRNLEAISLAKNMRPMALGLKVQLTYHF